MLANEPKSDSRKPWGTIIAVSLGWLFSAVDIILLILFKEEIAQDLNIELQAVRIAIGVGLLGSAFGGLIFAPLGDRLGRVRALGLSIIVYSVATALMAFADSIESLYALRFIAGVGTGAEWSIGFALLSEVWSQKSRGTAGGLVAAMFNLGTFIAIGLYGSPLGWRWAFGIMVAPALVAIVIRRLIPESPIWQKLNRAREEGELSDSLREAVDRLPAVAAFKGHAKWVTLKTTTIFAIMNLGFYAFSTEFLSFIRADPISDGGLGLDKAQEFPFLIALNLSGLISVFVAGWLSDVLGRRKAFVIFCCIGLIGFGWLSVLLSPDALPQLSTTQQTWTAAQLSTLYDALVPAFCICCMGFGVNGVMGIFTPELFPTYLRSTGPGVSQNLGKGIGGLMGPPLAGVLVGMHGYAFVLSLPVWVFLAIALLIWTLPEVGGRSLHFDDE